MNSNVTDPSDFANTSLPGLAQLDTLLRCHICKDFLKVPVLTSCGHTFCSICIRSYLSKEPRCPLCLTELRESMLRSEYLVNEIVEYYTTTRSMLLNTLWSNLIDRDSSLIELESESDKEDDLRILGDSSRPSKRNQSINTQSSSLSSGKIEKKDNSIESMFRRNGKMKPKDNLVQCPICSKFLPIAVLERKHLDECLTNQSLGNNDEVKIISETIQSNDQLNKNNQKEDMHYEDSPHITKNRRRVNVIPKEVDYSHIERYILSANRNDVQRLPKINFASLNLSQIRQKLAALNLPTHGTKQLMIDRYNHYEIIWNSNFSDSLNPIDESELRRQLMSWEVAQKQATGSSSNTISNLMKRTNTYSTTYQKLMDNFKNDKFDRKSWVKLFRKEFKFLKDEAMAKIETGKKSDSTIRNTSPIVTEYKLDASKKRS